MFNSINDSEPIDDLSKSLISDPNMERKSISLNEIDEMMNDYDSYSKYNYIPTKSDDFSNKNDRLSRSLYSKHSRDDREIENDNVIGDNSSSKNKRKKVSEEKYSQSISKNESEESQVIDSKEENDSNMEQMKLKKKNQ